MNRTTSTQVSDIRHSSFINARRALTLVEMLIGLAITLLMMAAIVNLFANIGSGVRVRRAAMEMGGQLRMMRHTLFNDLAGATCRTLPWQRPDEDPGYLEIVEGARSDKIPTGLVLNFAISQVPGSQITPPGQLTDGRGLGDYDDVLALTVRGEAAPFRGRHVDSAGQPQTIESNVAEVIWFAVENRLVGIEEPGMRKVYRRVLLVAPWADLSGITAPSGSNPESYEAFYNVCDVSVRVQQTGPSTYIWVPNTLGDLTKRENRFGHYYNFDTGNGAGFPHRFPHDGAGAYLTVSGDVQVAGTGTSLVPFTASSGREGEDLMLDNVLAFDVRVFDPGAPLFEYERTVLEPSSDNVFGLAVNNGVLSGYGAYVDLGWDNGSSAGPLIPDYDYTLFPNASQPSFQQERRVGWHPNTPNANRRSPAVYDTWSFHYEHDGINQDNDALTDEGTNGLDDNNQDGVDDILERETSPPYPVPLRGMQVKIRIYDPDTRQIREATVTRNFVPQ